MDDLLACDHLREITVLKMHRHRTHLGTIYHLSVGMSLSPLKFHGGDNKMVIDGPEAFAAIVAFVEGVTGFHFERTREEEFFVIYKRR